MASITERTRQGKPVYQVRIRMPAGSASATCNRYLAALSKALWLAVGELGWIASNPCSRVDKFRGQRPRPDSDRSRPDDIRFRAKSRTGLYLSQRFSKTGRRWLLLVVDRYRRR
jgi:hypothetical protein